MGQGLRRERNAQPAGPARVTRDGGIANLLGGGKVNWRTHTSTMVRRICREDCMSQTIHPALDTEKAKRIWAEYERTHDLGGMQNLAVGIDPESGEVHFGKSMEEIGERLEQEGRFKPLFYRWVNDPAYFHRGVRR